MKTTLTLLLASTALTAALGFPAWSAMQSRDMVDSARIATISGAAPDASFIILASDDDDRRRFGRDHDDDYDDDEDDDDDDDDDDDEDRRGGTRNRAPAGAVAPPQNGLFGNGAPPRVQVK
jgi:hypothetical protein